MKSTFVTMVLVISIIISGCTYNQVNQDQAVPAKPNSPAKNSPNAASSANEIDEKTTDQAVEDKNMKKDPEISNMMEKDKAMIQDNNGVNSFSGVNLAGNSSPLLDFNKADYDKALASDKNIVLYFYADWCPICRAEFPKMQAAFNQLNTDQVVGFRVNFNDNQTDSNEKDLARQFGVAYQHTKVFLKNDQRILKAPDTWDTTRYLEEINNKLVS
jgi:thiol-disulfide isomerase/thioredoxin